MYRSRGLVGPTTRRRPSFRGAKTHTSGAGRGGSGRRKSQYIDPARFQRVATPPADKAVYQPSNQFSDFAVHPQIYANLAQQGYTTPTPIQDQTIALALEGRDVIGIANTGTGKTAAFAVPALHRLMIDRDSRVLIIAPTRELAQQIEESCRAIAKGSGLFGALLIGGTAMGPQLRDLRANPSIVIGTPGRIKDHLERRSLDLSGFNLVVLDEVDRMLDMGFVNDVRTILGRLAPVRQSFFFSATMDDRVRGLIEGFAKDPVTVSLKAGVTSDHVHQDIVRYQSPSEKIEKLHDILIKEEVGKAILFDETQRKVERLSKELAARGFKTEAIHGGKTQGQRQRALKRFKDNEVTILVATDVAARGIDVADITHVINYSQPQTYDDYVHRIGRAGRAGRIGHALTFVD